MIIIVGTQMDSKDGDEHPKVSWRRRRDSIDHLERLDSILVKVS
jgi:hypothetical protein